MNRFNSTCVQWINSIKFDLYELNQIISTETNWVHSIRLKRTESIESEFKRNRFEFNPKWVDFNSNPKVNRLNRNSNWIDYWMSFGSPAPYFYYTVSEWETDLQMSGFVYGQRSAAQHHYVEDLHLVGTVSVEWEHFHYNSVQGVASGCLSSMTFVIDTDNILTIQIYTMHCQKSLGMQTNFRTNLT